MTAKPKAAGLTLFPDPHTLGSAWLLDPCCLGPRPDNNARPVRLGLVNLRLSLTTMLDRDA